MDKENTVIINFNGNCKAKIQVVNGKVKVLNAIDGWGNPIDLSKIIIEKVK